MQCKRYLTESDVTSVSERSDDEARRIAQVLVVVAELSVADVGETVVHLYIPPTNNNVMHLKQTCITLNNWCKTNLNNQTFLKKKVLFCK